MATIERRRNKAGDLISCIITVAEGIDQNGRQIRRRKTWKPPQGMTPRQIEKALQAASVTFEQEVRTGLQLDNRQTFAQYAQYVLELKQQRGAKPTTITRYESMLPRINAQIGHLKLADIRPQHLNTLYSSMSKAGERRDEYTAVVTPAAKRAAGKRGAKAKIAKTAGIGATTVSAFFAGTPIRVFSAEAIAKAMGRTNASTFKVKEGGGKLSPKTILEHHRLISTILAQADRELLVPYNAATKATPPTAPTKEPNYFQPQEIAEILKALESEPIKWQALTHLLMVTGCRRGEIAGLKWEKVDLQGRKLKIDTTLLKDKGKLIEGATKTNNTRFIPISQETANLLRLYRAEQNQTRLICGDQWIDAGYVFTGGAGLPIHPDSITHWLGEFAKRHGLKHINPHAFRHSAASILIANNTDIVAVSKMLGHANVTTTANIYSHVIEENKVKAAETLADVILRGNQKRQA